ncbi:MAG: type I restriction endonuclease [Anaerolineales bacterium]
MANRESVKVELPFIEQLQALGWDYLPGDVAVPIHYIDYEHLEHNDFLAINQFRVDPPWATGNRGYVVPDLVLFINGISLVVR